MSVPELSHLQSLGRHLREGNRVDDATFDALYPASVRAISSVYWTPISVAMRAAVLLDVGTSGRVLDVGSGPGKFCIIAAATTGATCVGVEQRGTLVQIARDAARRAGVENAEFVHGTFSEIDVTTFDALYLFNPFEENLWSPEDRIDEEVEHGTARFLEDVERAEIMLAEARKGTRVVTYHGFGGTMPPEYDLVHRELQHTNALEVWVKTHEARTGTTPDAA